MQTPKSLRLCVPQKQFVLVHDMYRTHGFVEQRMTRNFRNFHPAHFDSTDHRFAMGGCYGTCVRLLPFSIPPQAVGPLCSPSSLKMQNSKLSASLRAPKKQSVLAHDMYRTHGFVEQRMTRNFRNYRPAHFDSTDHRFAMGG